MSFKNRIVTVAAAAFVISAVVLAAYAQQTAPNQPGANQPSSTHPGTTQPGTTQPGTYQPGTTQPGAYHPGTTQPGATQPGAMQPMQYQANRIPANGNMPRENVDLFLIPCLVNANNAEVTLGNIAAQKAQSSAVKDFAQDMVKDHSEALKQVQQLQTTLTQQLRPQNPSNTPTAAALFEIGQEIEQTCLSNAQRELEQLNSSEFDQCYIGMQVGMHMQVSSVLSVFKNHAASPELRKLIDDQSQVVSRHLEQAKKIAKDLEHRENRESPTANRSSTNR